MALFILPGMGATSEMYGAAWRSLPDARFLDWPTYRGETSLAEMGRSVAAEAGIQQEDRVAGSSLGGMVALEAAAATNARAAILIGSAISSSEVNALLRGLAPFSSLTPLKLTQALAGKSSGRIGRTFMASDPHFIRSMCQALSGWSGPATAYERIVRIHGRLDLVIPCPKKALVVEDAGHLLAITHAEECVRLVAEAIEAL